MGTLWDDLQYGGRLLLRSPAFTLIAVATLALGIGANTAIFGIVNAVVLRPLPYPNQQQLVNVWETDNNRKIKHGSVPPGDFFDWRAQNQVFQGISAFQFDVFNLTGAGEPEQVWGGRVSANFFDLFGLKPIVGRTFRPDEEQPGHERVVIISHAIWARHFASDPNVVGHSVTINDNPYTLIGVLPADFNLLGLSRQFEVWVPLALSPGDIRRDNPSLVIFARLKPDVTIARANLDMDDISHRLSMQYPATNQGVGTSVVSMKELMRRGFGNPLLLLLASVGLVLLIACANVANLLLARAAGRGKEVAIRSTLGAGRLRLVRQLLTESVLLGLVGGAAGLLVGYGGLKILPAILPPAGGIDEIPRINMAGISGTVFAFTIGVAILTGIIFGLAPAFQFSQTNLAESLKEGGRSSTGGVKRRLTRNLLAIVEVGLSLVLLVGAGTLVRSLRSLLNSNPGFNPKNVLSMQVWLPESHHPGTAQTREFFQQLIERMRAIPGVNAASAINFLPLTSWSDFTNFDIAGRPSPPPRHEFVAQYRIIDSRYFQTMQVPLIRGRYFTDGDNQGAQSVAIVNQTLARQYWANQEAIGQRVRIHLQESKSVPWRPGASDAWLTIVGMVADTNERKPGDQSEGELYLPYLQTPSRMMRIVLRTGGRPESLASAARQAAQTIDPNQPVTEVQSMEQLVSASISSESLNAILLTFFAALAVILAGIGIYGVISYGVQQRTHEIGIRLALGAQPRDVLRLIVRQGVRLALIGILIGLGAAFGLIRVLSVAMFGIKSIDLPSSIIAVVVLFLVAFFACYIPARRATRVDPVQALRYE